MPLTILVAGATGFLGTALTRALRADGHTVTALTRDPAGARLPDGVATLGWNDAAAWREAVAGADAVVNLSGASIAGARWTPEVKENLRTSRLEPTRLLAEARPKVLVQASAVGIYGDRGDTPLDESSAPGDGFLARLGVDWEAAAEPARAAGGRVAWVRIGPVLGRGGGTLPALLQPPMLPFSPFKAGLGGPLGNGNAWMPWVHLDDVVGLLRLAIGDARVDGPINAVAPHPVRAREFAAALGRALHRPAVLPVPTFALRLLLGEFADALVASQRVRPAVAERLGYAFRFPTIDAALADLL